MKDSKTKQQFIELRASGYSFDKISKQMKVAKSTLIDWSKEFELEVSNLKAMELEALQEQYYIAKKTRIEIVGEHTKKIQEELMKRDLSELTTEKLFEIFQKNMNFLRFEEVEPIFQRKKELNLDEMLTDSLTTVEKWKAN